MPQPGRLAVYLDFLHIAPVAVVLLAATGMTVAALGTWPRLALLLPFLLSLLLTQFAIAIHNDYCDREVDARSKPWRVLPRGAMRPTTALRLSIALTVLGLAAAASLGWEILLMVAIGTGAGFVYNGWLKPTPWSWVPLWVAVPTLALCSFAVADRLEPALWPFYLIGAPLVVAINLVDSLMDIESDGVLGAGGLAQRLGPRRARLAAWTAMLLAFMLALTLRPSGGAMGIPYLVSMLLLAVGVLLDRIGVWRGHWLAIMLSIVSLAVGWVAEFTP